MYIIESESAKDIIRKPNTLCFKKSWKPDVDFLTSEQIHAICATIDPSLVEKDRVQEQEQAGLYVMKRALEVVTVDKVSKMHEHHKKLYSCMQHFCKVVLGNELDFETVS